MINFVTSNSEVLSLVIALLALLIAVYSVLYASLQQAKYSYRRELC